MSLVISAIRASRHRRNSRCPVASQAITNPPTFGVFEGDALLSDAAARERHPELSRIAALIDPTAVANEGELRAYGIAGRTHGKKICGHTDEIVTTRPFDLADVGAMQIGSWYSVLAGQELAPVLSSALRLYYGTEALVRPVPLPPPPESAEARVEREKRERERRLELALQFVAQSLDPNEQVWPGSMRRAESLIKNLKLLLTA